jgi:DNA-binding PadR family transcriptional regulator
MSYFMRATKPTRSVLWELAVLCLLREGPKHPYEMQRLLRARHKDEVLVLKRGSLYHAIARLEGAALIEARETSRDGRRPERTVYRLTEQGGRQLVHWLRDMIATPRHQPSELMTAVSFLVYLTPRQALAELETRVLRLEAEIAALDARVEEALPRVTRINLLESEYLLAMRRAELSWAHRLIDDIRTGRLSWRLADILRGLRASARAVRA